MTHYRGSQQIHPVAFTFANEFRRGELSRREFLSRATALGVASTVAYGLIGFGPATAEGHAGAAPSATTLRIQMRVFAQRDPRTYDWPEMGNLCRGLLENLIRYNRDGSFSGQLLDSWNVDDAGTEYVLTLRSGITWNNGDPFTAQDVAANIAGWCDGTVERNVMFGRMRPLVDISTGQMRDRAIEIVDDLTLRLTLNHPDITLVSSFSDYPAAIQHRDLIGTNPAEHNIGTGAFRIASLATGDMAVMERHPHHEGWRPTLLERVEFHDLGRDPANWLAGAAADHIDMTYETTTNFIDAFNDLGWEMSAADTASTVIIRPNQSHAPYDNADVRRAINMAVDPMILLELGYNNRGSVAENHHVSPIHPEYAPLPLQDPDPEGALALLQASGHSDHVFEVISLDDGPERNTADAFVAQLEDAGFQVRRRIIPNSSYTVEWASYPLSSTAWNHRALGVEVLNLAYRSGVAWNETGYANPEFDALLDQANGLADAEERRAMMFEIQRILQEDAVICQPYWRAVYRHYRPGVRGAEISPNFEIDIHDLAIST